MSRYLDGTHRSALVDIPVVVATIVGAYLTLVTAVVLYFAYGVSGQAVLRGPRPPETNPAPEGNPDAG